MKAAAHAGPGDEPRGSAQTGKLVGGARPAWVDFIHSMPRAGSHGVLVPNTYDRS